MPENAPETLLANNSLPSTTIYRFPDGSRAWGVVGETAAIRGIRPGNPEEIDAYWRMQQQESDMTEGFANVQELIDNAKNGREIGFTFAICGLLGKVPARFEGKFLGDVQFSVEKEGREPYRDILSRNPDFGFVPFDRVKILELSYEKIPGSPRHQVASAVRQACLMVFKILNSADKMSMSDLAIVAFQSPGENPRSGKVLESACFDRISLGHQVLGRTIYEPDSEEKDTVWVLNWGKLLAKEKEISRAAESASV